MSLRTPSILVTVFVMLIVALTAEIAVGQSPPGSAGAKAAAKCQQTIAKVNAKFLTQRLKRLATCSNAVLACIQAQPGVAACVTKATAKCQTQLGTPDAPDLAAEKLEGAVVKACGELPVADLLAAGGLGFSDATAACAAVGVTPLLGAADVARCLQFLHAGISEEAYGAELPRAAELTAQAGVSTLVVPDLPPFAGCGDCGTPPAVTGKVIAGCGAAIGKAGASFLGKARAGLDKCAAALVGCAQTKPGDTGCLTKAKATCEKLPEDLAKGRAAVVKALAKKCAGTVAFAALDAPTGLNVGALACECQQVGVAPVATLDDYALCLTRQHECRLAALLPTLVPSLDGLLAGQGLNVNELLCEPPVQKVAFAGSEPRALLGLFGSISKFLKNVGSGAIKSSASRFATRGTTRRVGQPLFGGCFASPGRSCVFRFPIRKRPASLQKGHDLALPPSLIIGVQRADGTFADDHFEVELGDTTNDSEVAVELTYADDLASCNFDLALAVMEDGVVSNYTMVEQTPHVIPPNDSCTAPTVLPEPDFSEILDVTAATVVGPEPFGASCEPGEFSDSVWYAFTAPADGTITADSFGSDFDSLISIWRGSCGDLIEAACANDSAGTLQSRVDLAVTKDTTYLIKVAVNGAPPKSSTLHFAFHFERAGAPPIASSFKSTLEELNSSTCFDPAHLRPNGSLYHLTFKYEDADGDVPTSGATADVESVFAPSLNVSRFAAVLETHGDGFSGTASFFVCTFFSLDTSVTTTVRLRDALGAGTAATMDLLRPHGAN